MSNTEYIIKVTTSERTAELDTAVIADCHGLLGLETEHGHLTEIHATAIEPREDLEQGLEDRRSVLFAKENSVSVAQKMKGFAVSPKTKEIGDGKAG